MPPIKFNRRLEARRYLENLLPRIMADAHLDEDEKKDLLNILKTGFLDKPTVREVFMNYLMSVRDEIMAAGEVTDDGRERCRAIVRELRIPQTFLPPDIVAIIEGKRLPTGSLLLGGPGDASAG